MLVRLLPPEDGLRLEAVRAIINDSSNAGGDVLRMASNMVRLEARPDVPVITTHMIEWVAKEGETAQLVAEFLLAHDEKKLAKYGD